jgi:tol-pal system protein YbgF
MKKVLTASIYLAILLSLNGCLKTRSQLRGDDDDSSSQTAKPIPNTPQDVQPQGQYAVDEIKTTMTTLEGRVEDLERAQKDQAAASKDTTTSDQLKKLDARITELETAQTNMLEAIKKMQDQGPAVDPASLFDSGKAKFDAEDWNGAIDAFSAFMKNPAAKNSKQMEDATFMRGESYFKNQKYKQAIADYSEFPEKYTKSKHMPEALYKIGISFEALGSEDDAKGFFQLLVDKFPKSTQAKKVKSKLK